MGALSILPYPEEIGTVDDHTGVEILLVEDNRSDADLVLRALRRNNIMNSVYTVRDGAAALDFLYAKGPYAGKDPRDVPKVILLDLKLPKVDGLEVLRSIKSDDRTRLIPVVMLTSSKEERDIVKSYRLGANSYIVKPVDFKEFAKAIGDLGIYWTSMNQTPL